MKRRFVQLGLIIAIVACVVIISANTASATGIGVRRFSNNNGTYPVSTLYFASNTNRDLRLQICADSIVGHRVYVFVWRPGVGGGQYRYWEWNMYAPTRCITFPDLEGAGPSLAGVNYYTWAMIDENPKFHHVGAPAFSCTWYNTCSPFGPWLSPSCWSSSGGYGMCDRKAR